MLTGQPEKKLRMGAGYALLRVRSRSRRAHRRDQRFASVDRRLERRGASFQPAVFYVHAATGERRSGKFGTPCERMHAAARRYCDCSAGLTWLFGPFPGPPPGSSLPQACWAELKCGLPVMARCDPIATLTPLPRVEIFGSGKLGTPCAPCTPSTPPPDSRGTPSYSVRRSTRPPSRSS